MAVRKVEDIQADIQEAEQDAKNAAKEMSDAGQRKRAAERRVSELKDEMLDVLFNSSKKPQK